MKLEEFNTFIGGDSFVLCRGKERISSEIVGIKEANKHLSTGGTIGWWVCSGYIIVDIDEGKEQVLQVIKQLGLKTLTCKTPKGVHLYFKTDKEYPQKTGMILPCGLKCDFRCASKGYVLLPYNSDGRVFNKVREIAEMPLEFTPMISRKESLLGLKDGEGRNATLFAHLMAYKHKGASDKQIVAMAEIINNTVFADSMPDREVEKIIENTKKYNENPHDSELHVINMGDVEIQDIKWLWSPFIPQNKITNIMGDPGDGKTFFACCLAAAVSAGGSLPNQEGGFTKIESGFVVYQTAEDGLADTLKPRLDKAGANCSKILVIDDFAEPLSLMDTRIEEMLKIHRPKLFIIDPLQAYLGEKRDMHRANEVRPVLKRIGMLAEKYSCVFLIIMHMSKGSQDRAIYKGLGSIDMAAAARSIILVGKNPQDPNDRAIAHVKSSLAEKGKSIGFTLDNQHGFVWNGISELSADDMLAQKSYGKKESKMEDCKMWITVKMINGNVLAETMIEKGKKAGFSESMLNSAKRELGIISKKDGFGKDAPWYWGYKESP
ncbi:MAG: AAA family ATPase [Bacillota bacterium]|nr:AAA family ATPase [Bacillota bacterium]